MPLELRAQVLTPRLTTHESLRFQVELTNSEATARDVPAFHDTSGSLSVEVCTRDGTLLRRMNAKSGQLMRLEGRPDPRVTRDSIGPGATWRLVKDAVGYHYPLPAGELALRFVYRLSPLETVETPLAPIEVHEEALESLETCRDNPIMDGLSLLLGSRGEGGPRYVLRHVSRDRPLSGWYSETVLAGVASRPFLAANDFFQSRSFGPFYARWAVWEQDGRVHARGHASGRPKGADRAAPLPEGERLLRAAICEPEGELLVFTRAGDELRCWSLKEDRLERRFAYRGPATRAGAALLAVRRDREGRFHLASTGGGLWYARLDARGEAQWEDQPVRTRLEAYACEVDPVSGWVHALFWSGPLGRDLQLVHLDLQKLAVTDLRPAVHLRGELTELAFDVDAQRRFHLLVATSHGRLYHYPHTSGPTLVGEGRDPFFPRVSARDRVYLGCFRRGLGYRYLQVSPRRHERKLTDYEIVV